MSQIKRLQLAKRTLQNVHAPFYLRVTSYLRLSCFTLDEQGEAYGRLINALSHYDREWWKQCHITQSGELHSKDPVLNGLLQPVEEFYQTKVRSQRDVIFNNL